MLDVHQLPMGYPYIALIAHDELVLQPSVMYEPTAVLNAALSVWQNEEVAVVGVDMGLAVVG
jgi:hypothetical protein